MSTVEENKKVVRGCIEESSNIQGDIEKIPAIIDKYFSPEFIHHTVYGDFNIDTMVPNWSMGHTAFPDIKIKIQDIIAEGDKVVVRTTTTETHKGYFANIPPTGKKISISATVIFRVDNGKIQEEWTMSDTLVLYQQIGLLPPAEEIIQAYIDSLK